jgi:hypothetical protein
MNNKKGFNIIIDSDLHLKLKLLCVKLNISMVKYIETLIVKALQENDKEQPQPP